MSVCVKPYVVGITFIVVTFLMTGSEAQQTTNRCENGWSFFSENGSTFANGMCYLAVKTPMPVADAERYCANRMAYLIDLERIDQFSFRDFQQPTTTVPQFIFDNFIDFWSGMRVSKEDRLIWQAYGPKYVEASLFRRPWNWKQGQPISNYSGTCGSVTLGQRELISEFTEAVEIVFNGQIDVGLDPCSNRLPFVCEKPAIQKIVNPTNICPNGWVGHQYINYCYRFVNKTATLQGAHQQCRALGGYLTVVKDPGFTSFNQSLLEVAYLWYFSRNSNIPFWADLSDFKSDSDIVGQCNSFRYNFETLVVTSLLCNASLNYMCSRPLLPSADVSISLESPYLDQDELLNYPQWARLQLSFMLDRPPKDNEIVFLKTPTTYLNSTRAFIPWQSQNIRYTVASSARGDDPYYVNVTLISNIVPLRKRRQTGGEIPELVDFNQIIQTTGYYGLGVFQLSPPSYSETEPKLVRYSESDLYIYLARVPVRDWVFGANGRISEQDIVNQILLNDKSNIVEMFPDLGSVVFGSGPTIPDTKFPIVQYYGGIIEDISDRPGMLTLRLFATPFSSRSLQQDSEQEFIPVFEEFLRTSLNPDEFGIERIQVVSTVSCSTQDFTDTRIDTIFTLPSTRSGEIGYSWERCYGGKGAYAKAVCEGGYDTGTRWGQIEYNTGCEVFPELNTSSSTRDLKILSETVITEENVNATLMDTYKLTLPELNLTSADIIYTADILYNYWKFTTSIHVYLDYVYNILNNILQAQPNEISSAQELSNAANRIILSVDEITHLFKIRGTRTLRFVRDFVASTVRYQTGFGDLVIGLELEDSPVQEITNATLFSVGQQSDVTVSKTDTAIYLSRELVEGAPTRLSFHIYSKTELFTKPYARFKINSKVAAARMDKNGIPVLDLGDDRVTVVFETIEDSENAICGYWNYSADETAGGWETEGCVLRKNGSRIVCECDHLTNFAVLIDLEAHTISKTHKVVLAIVTKIGLVISAIALGITVLTFIIFKHLRNGRGQQVLVNLSVAMLCAAIIFLVGMDRVESVTGCKVVAALLHYFILVSFAWMLVEGILQYLRFVKVLGTYIPNFMMKSMIPAWGIPLIPVIIVLAVDHDLYYGGKGYCWLAYDAMLYAFIIPIALVISANLVVFTIVIVNLCRRRVKGMKTNQSENKLAMLHFKAGVSIFVLLGLTWMFGFMAVNEAQLVFHYLFAILNAFQGLFIFLLFTAREPKIRQAWRQLCCKKSQYKATGTSSDSNTGKKSADTNSTSDSNTTAAQFSNPQFEN